VIYMMRYRAFSILNAILSVSIFMSFAPSLAASPMLQCVGGRIKTRLESDSMRPLASRGSHLVLQCITHPSVGALTNAISEDLSLLRPPVQLGDVVMFRTEVFEGSSGFKRIVGGPGDTIGFTYGTMFINGREVSEEATGDYGWHSDNKTKLDSHVYIETLSNGASYPILKSPNRYERLNEDDVTVPEGFVFVLGDNRSFSIDSRVNQFPNARNSTLGLIRIIDIEAKLIEVVAELPIPTQKLKN